MVRSVSYVSGVSSPTARTSSRTFLYTSGWRAMFQKTLLMNMEVVSLFGRNSSSISDLSRSLSSGRLPTMVQSRSVLSGLLLLVTFSAFSLYVLSILLSMNSWTTSMAAFYVFHLLSQSHLLNCRRRRRPRRTSVIAQAISALSGYNKQLMDSPNRKWRDVSKNLSFSQLCLSDV